MIPDGLETALEFLCYAAGAMFAVNALIKFFGWVMGTNK